MFRIRGQAFSPTRKVDFMATCGGCGQVMFGGVQKDGSRFCSEACARKQPSTSSRQAVLVKTYRGSERGAFASFQADSPNMARQGYFPTSQSWAPGSYGCGSFILALLLCFVLIGFIVFVYMLLVKPNGVLSVTYEYQEPAEAEKTCPRCAEKVKAAALACRFCGYEFEPALQNNG